MPVPFMVAEENILAVLELSEDVAEKRSTRLESLLAEFSITHLRRSPAVAQDHDRIWGEKTRIPDAAHPLSNLGRVLAGTGPL